MSELCSHGFGGHTSTRNLAAVRIADGLGLIASPIFAAMAILTNTPAKSPVEAFCSTMHASSLVGMTTMYLLMSVFHVAPWIRLIGARFGDDLPSQPHT